MTDSPPRFWRFRIPLPPRGKGRPRFARVGTGVRAYTDAETESYEAAVASFAAAAMPAAPLECTLLVEIVAVFHRPKRLCGKRSPDGNMLHTSRPDADNIAKAVLDGMAARWRDDAQVADLRVVKLYAARNESPHVRVSVRAVVSP